MKLIKLNQFVMCLCVFEFSFIIGECFGASGLIYPFTDFWRCIVLLLQVFGLSYWVLIFFYSSWIAATSAARKVE
jgi:hypothetical protein